jgi:hypothetical protein
VFYIKLEREKGDVLKNTTGATLINTTYIVSVVKSLTKQGIWQKQFNPE